MRPYLIMAVIVYLMAYPAIVSEAQDRSRSDYSGYNDVQIVNAIKRAENSVKWPYGIKSVKCSGEAECRQICLNSVRNGRKRWIKAGKPDDLIVFIGKRYSPPSSNPNWVKLVKHFLTKQ